LHCSLKAKTDSHAVQEAVTTERQCTRHADVRVLVNFIFCFVRVAGSEYFLYDMKDQETGDERNHSTRWATVLVTQDFKIFPAAGRKPLRPSTLQRVQEAMQVIFVA